MKRKTSNKIRKHTRATKKYIRSKKLRYNSFTGRIEKADGTVFEDKDLNDIFVELKERGLGIGKDLVRSIINSNKIKTYNPLRNWLENCPLGCGEIERLIQSLSFKEDSDMLRQIVVKWLLQHVAVIMDDAVPRLVLVLIGASYIGKTEFFRRLLPEEMKQYYAESGLDQGKDTHFLMAEHLLINVDELAGILGQKNKVEAFKSLVSGEFFTNRRTYGTFHSRVRRRAVLGATSNKKDVILDQDTMNTRIIPLELHDIDHDLLNAIDRDKLFGELRELYKKYDNLQLTHEELTFLSRFSEDYTVTDPVLEVVIRWIEPSTEFMSSVEMSKELSKRAGVKIPLRKLASAMGQLGYPRTRQMTNGQKLRGYLAWVKSEKDLPGWYGTGKLSSLRYHDSATPDGNSPVEDQMDQIISQKEILTNQAPS